MSEGVLKRFYNSKEWAVFRKMIIAERGPICFKCNKAITEAKQLQIHHIEELTESNYTDTTISLNPENVIILCQQCHNKTHGRWSGAVKRKPRGVYIVYGPPLSGKTSYVRDHMESGDIIVDMDALYQAISMQPLYDKPNNLRYNVFSVQDVLLDNIKTRYGNFNSAWIIGGYADKYKREKLAKELGAELIYIKADKEDCLYRLQYCNDSRQKFQDEWTDYINKWFSDYQE